MMGFIEHWKPVAGLIAAVAALTFAGFGYLSRYETTSHAAQVEEAQAITDRGQDNKIEETRECLPLMRSMDHKLDILLTRDRK